MKLITFQSMEAFKKLIDNGYLETDKRYINMNKVGMIYSWVVDRMNQNVKNKYNTEYPLWCWVKCYNNICPSKRVGEPVKGFDVKITFNKKDEDVFITDFRRYSFLLNNMYIPNSGEDKEMFLSELKKYNITEEELRAYIRRDKYKTHRTDKEYLEICKKIRNSFDRCITCDSDILQGCVWRINLDEVESIEVLNDKNYRYGSLNYIRKDGKRKDWIKEFYKLLDKDNC